MADKKKPKPKPLRSTKRTKEQAAQDRARYTAEVQREYERKHQEKLPEAQGIVKGYFTNHPVQAEHVRSMAGPLGDAFIDSSDSAIDSVSQWFDSTFGGSEPRPQAKYYGDPNAPMPNTTTVAKTPRQSLQEKHDLGRAGAVKKSIGPSIRRINDELGIHPEDAETILHNFADSASGRPVAENILAGQDTPEALDAYRAFAKEWSDYSMDKERTGSIEVDDPVIINASSVPPVEVAKQIKGAGGKPVIINDASDLGFRSDKVVLVERKGGKKRSDPESARNSVEPPILTKDEFIDVVKLIGGGGGR